MHEIAKFHFLLDEGRKGNHLIFAPQTIRLAFQRDPDELKKLLEEHLDDVNDALNRTFSLASFEEKKEFINGLGRDVQHAMIFSYFQLLDGLETESGEREVH